MYKTLTFVKMQQGWQQQDFFKRWCEHTQQWDLKDHPEISLNRLLLIDEHAEYAGIAENHWPDKAAIDSAVKWYETEAGKAHWADLCEFMDVENSLTVTITQEAVIDIQHGIRLL